MTNLTRPTADQIRFRSSKTGDNVLDQYLEATELGDRPLADLLADLWGLDGNIDPDALDLRINTSTNQLEARLGDHGTDTIPWTPVTGAYLFRGRGTHASGQAYQIGDVVINSGDGTSYLCHTPHTSGSSSVDATKFIAMAALPGGLADMADLLPINNALIVGNGSNWIGATGGDARNAIGLGSGDSPTFAGIDLPDDSLDTSLLASGGLPADVTVNDANWSGTALAILHGGTGATTKELALVNLGITATAAEISQLGGITIKDEDDMASNSATALATQQSIKAYADRNVITANTTITVAASGADYTTVGAAYASLNNKRIANDVTVTISVAAGTYTESTLVLSHPQGDRIKIVGAGSGSTTLSFASGLFGIHLRKSSLGDIQSLTLANAGSTTYGMVVELDGYLLSSADLVIDGFETGLYALNGATCYITALTISDSTSTAMVLEDFSYVRAQTLTVSGSSALSNYTIFSYHQSALKVQTMTVSQASVRGMLAKLGSSIILDSGGTASISGAVSTPNGYVVLGEDGSVVILDGATISSVVDSGATGALVGSATGSYVSVLGATLSGSCYAGVVARNQGFVMANSAVLSGAYTDRGIWAWRNSGVSADSVTVSGSCRIGISNQVGSNIDAASANITGATDYGVTASDGATGYMPYASVSGATTGFYAARNATLEVSASTVTGATVDYTPAINTLGSFNSYIFK